MEDCLFCKIAAKEIPSDTVYEDDQVVAFDDINPAAPVHVLVIPREHIATLNDVEEGHASLVGHMHVVAKALAAEKGLSERGYRLVFNCGADANQTVFHIHLHLLGGRAMSWPPG